MAREFGKQCLFCKPIAIDWEDCAECGICRIQNGMAEWRYYIYLSKYPLTQEHRLGLLVKKEHRMNSVWGKTALRLYLCEETYRAFSTYAPPAFVEMLNNDPMFPRGNE